MTVPRSGFERVAREVSRRAAELLGASTYVVDHLDTVVAASSADTVGKRLAPSDHHDVRVPLRAHGHEGQVVVGEPTCGESISPRLAQVVVELVINQAAMVDGLPQPRDLKNKFIHDLLRGVERDEETLVRQARILGIDPTPPRAVILVDARDFVLGGASADDGRAQRRAQLVIGSVVAFFRLPNDSICAYIGEGEVAVLKASDTKNLANWANEEAVAPSWANIEALRRAAGALMTRLRADTGGNVQIALGRYHRGMDGLARSYQDARAALKIGRRFLGANHVHSLDGLGVAAFVGVPDEKTKIDLARYLLSPLDTEPELTTTLSLYFEEDGQPTRAAARLGVHRNTLTYRLEKIALLTGLDPRRFDQAVQLRLALLLRALPERPVAED
ncbi:PucR family transcriptional regulator [Deinococcus pimensis]|uniref:PucR family transcriptional regulator n=1 Tax=Deinococcus pimensis TaxID=309888 RepID=UPI0004828B5E|nr:helix-turn-helix domain-containing protein [Deinococcus pimensis]